MTDNKFVSLPPANLKQDIKAYVVDGRKGEILRQAPTIFNYPAAYRRIGGVGGIDVRGYDNVYVAAHPASGADAHRYVQVGNGVGGSTYTTYGTTGIGYDGTAGTTGAGTKEPAPALARGYEPPTDKFKSAAQVGTNFASGTNTYQLGKDYEPASATGGGTSSQWQGTTGTNAYGIGTGVAGTGSDRGGIIGTGGVTGGVTGTGGTSGTGGAVGTSTYVVGGQPIGGTNIKGVEEDRKVGVGSRRIDTGGATTTNKYPSDNRPNIGSGNQTSLERYRAGESTEGCCKQCYDKVCQCGKCGDCGQCCQCGKCPRWLWIPLLLLLLGGLITAAIFGWRHFHPATGLPAGYECPEGYFQNNTKCLECPDKTKWNGTDCVTDDNKIIVYTEAAPVKIDPTVARPIVGNKNATGQSQCADGEHYYEGRCLKCPEGSAWNGTHCKVIVAPSPSIATTVTDEIKAQLEASKAATNTTTIVANQSTTTEAKLVCKQGEFILNGKCLKCPENTTWDGTHCVRKVVITTTQDEKLAPIAAHNEGTSVSHAVRSTHLRRKGWSL